MDLRALASLLRRCVGLTIAGGIVGIALAALWTSRMPDLYESRTRVIASSAQADLGAAYTGALLSVERVRGYVVLVESRILAQRVKDDLDLDESLDQLIADVQATVVDETNVLELQVVDEDPTKARDIAQAYSEELVDLTRVIETPENGTAPVRLTVIDDATTPTQPFSPRPKLNMFLGFLAGMVLGLGVGLARVLLSTRITSSDDVEQVTSAAILGSIGRESGRRNRLINDLPPHDPRSEAFRVLRTNLQFVDIDTANKVLVVTSAMPGEGKSSTVVNLALSMARVGARVLLVDGDLRRPVVADMLKLDGSTGLTSVLVGKTALADAIQLDEASGLHVLTTGPTPPNASELFQTHAMEGLVAELRSQFDVVLFDAAPLLPVADAAVLGAHTDGALLVVRHRRTKREQLASSLDRLERTGVTTVGIVLNQVASSRWGGDGGYTYYGGGYGSYTSKRPRRFGRRTPTSSRSADAGRP